MGVFALWKLFKGWDDYSDDSDPIIGLYCATRIILIRDEFQESGPLRYETLLQAATHCRATNDRDTVFGFRGVGGSDRLLPDPDYNDSVEDVYIKTAAFLLCYGTSLDFLALGGVSYRALGAVATRQRASDLPSWFPDFRYRSQSEPFVPCDRASWNTGGPLTVPATVVSSHQLRLRVKAFDFVDVTCAKFNSYSVAEQKTAVEEALSLKRRLPNNLSHQTWLELIARALIFDLDIEDQPAGPEYLRYFHYWLKWLQSSSTQADLAEISSNEYARTIRMRIDGWKAFMTKCGIFCT
jgi:hypothetical protein